MTRMVSAVIPGTSSAVSIEVEDLRPDSCPVCHHAMDPVEMPAAALVGGTPFVKLEITYRCTRQVCAWLFIGRYSRDGAGRDFQLADLVPLTFVRPTAAEEIEGVSPDYVEIYAQAAEAEARGHDEIAGGGYRKALEFLIKDYCISLCGEDEGGKKQQEIIKGSFLGTCIADHVEDARVKQAAKLATWLANDEVHYMRRWNKDIEELKKLVRLTALWIEGSLVGDQFKQEMDPEEPDD